MKKNILLTLGAVALMAACTEDYKDWAAPMSNVAPETTATLTMSEGGTVTPETATIDFANFTAEQTTVKVCTLNPAEAKTGVTKGDDFIVFDDEATFQLTNGEMQISDLKSYLEAKYGKAPMERTINAYVYTSYFNEKVSVRSNSDKFELKAKLAAPFIDKGYYLTGDFAGWNKDGALAFTHIGDDNSLYDNPEFQIVFTTTADNQYWKIIPQGNYDNDFWAGGEKGVVGIAVDGDTSMEGTLTTDNPGAGKIEQAGMYRMTINMMEYTYKIEKLDFTEFIYVPGNAQGWSPESAAALHSPNFDGVYTGYAVLDGGFKFTKKRTWSDGEYNWGDFNTVPEVLNNGAGTDTNIYCDNAGLYFLKVDVAAGKLEATKITNMNLVGDFNGWNQADEAQQMTWNAENLCFSISGAGVNANGWKFTANNAWDINLGSNDSVEPSTIINDLVGNGKNIGVVGTTIKLYPCRTTSDKIYCTVE